jgi:excisionase family DNA binding protein
MAEPLEPGPSEARTALKFIAKTLGDLRRRHIQSGLYWGPELEACRLLASDGQGRPDLAPDVDLGDRLAVDYDDAAKLLSVSSRTVRRLVASGEIPVVMIGTLPRITTADLEAYVDTLDRRRSA